MSIAHDLAKAVESWASIAQRAEARRLAGIAATKAWKAANPEKVKAQKARYRDRYREDINAKKREARRAAK